MTELNRVDAAQAVLGAHNIARRLEDGQPPAVDLYHLLDSLLEWCDASGVDFDAELSNVRADLAAHP